MVFEESISFRENWWIDLLIRCITMLELNSNVIIVRIWHNKF